MPNLVGQRQLRNLRRNAAVVVHKRDDARVERSLRALVQPGDRFRVRLVLLTDSTGSAGRRGHPGQPEGTAGEVSARG